MTTPCRRQWWAALATLQDDFLPPLQPLRGVWLASPLPALYEPELLEPLQGWVWAPPQIAGGHSPSGPLLPGVGSAGTDESPRPRQPLRTPGPGARRRHRPPAGADHAQAAAGHGPGGQSTAAAAGAALRSHHPLGNAGSGGSAPAGHGPPGRPALAPGPAGARSTAQRGEHGAALLAEAGGAAGGDGPEPDPAAPGRRP